MFSANDYLIVLGIICDVEVYRSFSPGAISPRHAVCALKASDDQPQGSGCLFTAILHTLFDMFYTTQGPSVGVKM